MSKVKFYDLPYDWQQLMLMRQAQAGNRINPSVFEKKIDASKSEGGFNFREDKEVKWNDIFQWDGKKPLPKCPLPESKYPKEDTLTPRTYGTNLNETIEFGGMIYRCLAETEFFKIYATKDTIRGMQHNKKSLVLMQRK